MFFSAMDKRVFVYSSIFISFEMFRCSLHWVLNSSQFAFLKMKRSGIFCVGGISCLIWMG